MRIIIYKHSLTQESEPNVSCEKWLQDIQRKLSMWEDCKLPWPWVSSSSPISAKDLGSNVGKMRMVGLDQIIYKMPADGVPLFPYWKGLAMDIYYFGFEPLREPLEVKVNGDGLLECVKGLGRLSIIYFGAFWTFLKKDELTEEQRDDFCRHTTGKMWIPKSPWDWILKLTIWGTFHVNLHIDPDDLVL